MVDDSVILDGFPAIPSHWASCLFGCVDAICSYQFATPPLADCEYDHTYHYARAGDGIRRAAGGTNLDLELRAIPVDVEATTRRIRELHGVECQSRAFFSAGEFESFALQTLRRGRALVIIFDWFYVACRREYQRIHAPHGMCLVGIEAGGGPVHLQDQYHGRLQIPGDVFAAFIAFSTQEGGDGAKFIELERTATRSPPSSNRLVELGRNVELFLENLESTDSAHGLAALQAFRAEIGAFMEAERAAPAVFYVPGMWQFAMQRAHFAEALRVIEKVHPEFSIPGRDELMMGLEALHRCWFDLNLNAEAALITNRPRLLAKALSGLDAIIRHEREMPRRLELVLRASK